MILCNLALEIEHLLDEEFLKKTIDTCIHEVMDVFYRPELGLVVENLTPTISSPIHLKDACLIPDMPLKQCGS